MQRHVWAPANIYTASVGCNDVSRRAIASVCVAIISSNVSGSTAISDTLLDEDSAALANVMIVKLIIANDTKNDNVPILIYCISGDVSHFFFFSIIFGSLLLNIMSSPFTYNKKCCVRLHTQLHDV